MHLHYTLGKRIKKDSRLVRFLAQLMARYALLAVVVRLG
jgi:hypothetical protein